jgi:hypothetical protein
MCVWLVNESYILQLILLPEPYKFMGSVRWHHHWSALIYSSCLYLFSKVCIIILEIWNKRVSRIDTKDQPLATWVSVDPQRLCRLTFVWIWILESHYLNDARQVRLFFTIEEHRQQWMCIDLLQCVRFASFGDAITLSPHPTIAQNITRRTILWDVWQLTKPRILGK